MADKEEVPEAQETIDEASLVNNVDGKEVPEAQETIDEASLVNNVDGKEVTETHETIDEASLVTMSDEQIPANPILCGQCRDLSKVESATAFCKDCEENLCFDCEYRHRKLKTTKMHNVEALNTRKCDECREMSEEAIATVFCVECDELLCPGCENRHRKLKTSRLHQIRPVEEYDNQIPTLQCGICKDMGVDSEPVAFCTDCIPQELVCLDCLKHHKATKLTRHHNIETSLEKYQYDKQEFFAENTTTALGSLQTVTPDRRLFKPGKPKAYGTPTSDTIRLSWSSPPDQCKSSLYQIRYKTTEPLGEWKFYDEQFKEHSVVLANLKSGTTFVFKVRILNGEEEGPYSDQSDELSTKQSAASRAKEFSTIMDDAGGILEVRKLPMRENIQARDETAKTRKFNLGDTTTPLPGKEKTILLVGATGSGKTTLVDGFINYILGVSWEDTYRLTLVDLEEEERGNMHNQAFSQTQWITTYCINLLDGSRLDYKLNIIDTPGFGDTRGFERDQQIVDQIRQLFSSDGEQGIVFLDAICFLTKAPDARLTTTQKYLFNAILSLFGKDIAGNINIMVTFADGKAPPVLAALDEANLPYDKYFPFNNSGLTADNSGENMSPLSSMFWEMGCRSFASFFDHLSSLQTKSLKQSKEVLTKRREMELTIENIAPLVTNGLSKVEEMREEIQLLEQHKTEIKANKEFTYTVDETKQTKIPLPAGRHVTNCIQCNVTCHRECRIPNDADKARCRAMDANGNCTQCIENCFWDQHANTPYIFEYQMVQQTKTYAEKEKKYRKAKGEKMTLKMVVARMSDELVQLEVDILSKMTIVTSCNNTLKEIALRPDPLSVKEHIDILIEGEKQEGRPGYKRRIAALQMFRKKANIGQDVQYFRQSFAEVKTVSTFHVEKKESKGIFRKVLGF